MAVVSEKALTFIAEADARVLQTSPNANDGTWTSLHADGDPDAAQTSYIRFQINGMSGTVQNVKLRVFCTTNGTKDGPAVSLADNNWTEAGAAGMTWNTQPTLLSAAFDNKGEIATDTWVEYNVTSLVADSKDGVTFSAREGTAAPQLVVELAPWHIPNEPW